MEFGIRDLRLMLLNIFEFRECQRREVGAFCMGFICNYSWACTIKPYENLKVKKRLDNFRALPHDLVSFYNVNDRSY
jgi:hypothetical protein